MAHPEWLDELQDCQLCEWRCGVDRLEDEGAADLAALIQQITFIRHNYFFVSAFWIGPFGAGRLC